ncbi:MAG: hypothetical protein JRG85_12010 [Deltaproteobacteria bacterium]|nr:hypothetical protein [Deltaproteobacteria bacterium]
MSASHLVVVPHTHWDREWYRTHEEFRYRLVQLVDRLLDILEGDPAYRHFTLDGQTIVVDDYLEVRPQARERLEKLVRDGRLLVGPWYVLPDEWLVSGEALVRNLRLGLRTAQARGGAMRLGYVPDQFGHVGQLPQIFAGFGFDAAVLWRGVGPGVERTPFVWEAPDGTRLLTVYLPNGYGNAAQLPADPDALAQRLRIAMAGLRPFACTPTLLLMNGSDHLTPQPGLPAALEAAAAQLDGIRVEIGTLPGFVERVRGEAPADLDVHCGELRSGQRSPLLPGCASARSPQKRADARNDTLLTAVLEPLAAWLGVLGGEPDTDVLDLAWRVALQNHPHDSICGCSIDEVHDQMDTRFRRVHEIATTHLARVAGELVAQVAVPRGGFGRGAGESLVVWNPGPEGPAVVDSTLELDVRVRNGAVGPFHLRDASGRRLAVVAELVEPEREHFRITLPKGAAHLVLDSFGETFAGSPVRDTRFEVQNETLALQVRISALHTGYDVRAARRRIDEALARDEVKHFDLWVMQSPRIRLRFADELPGLGLRVYRVARGRARPRAEARVQCGRDAGGGAFAESPEWRVEADVDGRVRLTRRADGLAIDDAVRIVSEGDRGDEYNFDPVPHDVPVERPESVRVRPFSSGEAEAGVEIEARYRVPEGLTHDRFARAQRQVALPVRLRLRLREGSDRIDLDLDCDNRARDHRLRVLLRAPFRARRFQVESAFEVARRPIAPASPDSDGPQAAEQPIGACPQRRFAAIDDGRLALTVANRGAAEAEAVPEADGSTSLAVSVLRAVGWLSRDDLVQRPGHAGPGIETPGAQVPGPHRLELSLRLHPADEALQVVRAHDFARPPQAFPGGGSSSAPLADGSRLLEVEPADTVLVSAVEPRAEGGSLVRLWNRSGEPVEARLAWTASPAELLAVDLADRPDPDTRLEPDGPGAVRVALPPHGILALRASPGPFTEPQPGP